MNKKMQSKLQEIFCFLKENREYVRMEAEKRFNPKNTAQQFKKVLDDALH